MKNLRQNDAELHKLLYPTDEVSFQHSNLSPPAFDSPVYRDANKKGVYFRVPFYHSDRGSIHDALKVAADRFPGLLGEVAYQLLTLPGFAKLSDLLLADAGQIAPALLAAVKIRLTPGMDCGV